MYVTCIVENMVVNMDDCYQTLQVFPLKGASWHNKEIIGPEASSAQNALWGCGIN